VTCTQFTTQFTCFTSAKVQILTRYRGSTHPPPSSPRTVGGQFGKGKVWDRECEEGNEESCASTRSARRMHCCSRERATASIRWRFVT
jgi:hypothetical protein